jgi:hypothetical protein
MTLGAIHKNGVIALKSFTIIFAYLKVIVGNNECGWAPMIPLLIILILPSYEYLGY